MPMWIKGIGAVIVAALGTSLGGLIARFFVALGIGYVSYNFIAPDFVELIQGQLGGVPAEVLQVLALAKVDVAVTIIVSAVAVALAGRLVMRRT